MLADKSYEISPMQLHTERPMPLVHHHLVNRFQLWRLTKNAKNKYIVLAHFPLGDEDEYVTEQAKLSPMGKQYSQVINDLINHYANDHLTVCADFNFNPYLINQWQDRVLDQITNNNSLLLTIDKKTSERSLKTVTVDGILLSQKEKQKYYASIPSPSLFRTLTREHNLFKSYLDTYLEEHCHKKSHR